MPNLVDAQGNSLLDKSGQIINGGKALTTDSLSSIFSGLVGTVPAAVYIESATGAAAGGKTGLTATVVGVLFIPAAVVPVAVILSGASLRDCASVDVRWPA